MKKLTINIGVLLLATSGFSTNPDNKEVPNEDLVREIVWTAEDLIEFIKEEEWNGRVMTKETADIYIKHLLNIVSKAEDLKVLDCENCDEID